MASTGQIDMAKEKLAKDSPIYEELKHNPFYRAWLQEGKEIGVVEGKGLGIVEGKELGIVESALTLMGTLNLNADQAADALEFDDAVRNEFYRRLNGKYRPK
jgi:predicted transposase YdaD